MKLRPKNMVEFDDGLARVFGIHEHEGYLTPFTRQEARQAKFSNGARVKKVSEDASGDITKLGTEGTVLGSIHAPGIGTAYFVEWDDKPHIAIFVIEGKIK